MRNREKLDKERLRSLALKANKKQLMQTKGYQRLLASEYDRKLKEARSKGRKNFSVHETLDGSPSQPLPAADSAALDLKALLAAAGEEDAASDARARAGGWWGRGCAAYRAE